MQRINALMHMRRGAEGAGERAQHAGAGNAAHVGLKMDRGIFRAVGHSAVKLLNAAKFAMLVAVALLAAVLVLADATVCDDRALMCMLFGHCDSLAPKWLR